MPALLVVLRCVGELVASPLIPIRMDELVRFAGTMLLAATLTR